MSTPPPERTLPPRPEPIKVDATFHDLDRLDYIHHELDRALLMLALAVEHDTRAEREHRRMLLDAAKDALGPAVAMLGGTLRVFNLRRHAARVTRGRIALRRRPGANAK